MFAGCTANRHLCMRNISEVEDTLRSVLAKQLGVKSILTSVVIILIFRYHHLSEEVQHKWCNEGRIILHHVINYTTARDQLHHIAPLVSYLL